MRLKYWCARLAHPGIIFVLFLLVPMVGAQPARNPASGASTPEGKLVYITVPAPSLTNSLYHVPTEQLGAVYLPPSYEKSTGRYPVVYFLPGFGDMIQMYTEWQFYQGFSLKPAMDRLIGAGKVREMIVVIPNGQQFSGGSFYVNSPLNGNWEDYVVKDLVAHIDGRYRTLASAASRAICGHSMGGFGALNLAMRHPEVFGAVYALSPGLAAPGGLRTSSMLSAETTDKVLAEIARLAPLPACRARVAFLAYTSHLAATAEFPTLFALAYALAFSPDPTGPPPHLRFPFRGSGEAPVLDPQIMKLFENGFGNLDEKLTRFHDNLTKLRLVAVDVGTKDEEAWLPAGCRYYARAAKDKGIPVRLIEFEGGHQDHLRQRIEEFMLPALSAVLTPGSDEPARASPPASR